MSTYKTKLLAADLNLLPKTSYDGGAVPAPGEPGKVIVSTASRANFEEWLTALDNASRKYEVVMTPSP